MCIEGTIAARDESTAFPLGPEIQARLTVSLIAFVVCVNGWLDFNFR